MVGCLGCRCSGRLCNVCWGVYSDSARARSFTSRIGISLAIGRRYIMGVGSVSLSKASPYEQRFGTRHRRVGRPSGSEAESGSPCAGVGDVHPLLATLAKRSATAVVLDANRSRLAELFRAELKVLKRRGVSRVAEDAGVKLPETEQEV